MAMGKRRRHAKQASMWVATNDLPRSAAHPFYTRLNQILETHDFDGYVEGLLDRHLVIKLLNQEIFSAVGSSEAPERRTC